MSRAHISRQMADKHKYKTLNEAIDHAAMKGFYKLELDEVLSNSATEYLQENGYKIKSISNRTIISW